MRRVSGDVAMTSTSSAKRRQDLRVTTVVTAAITVERLAPARHQRVARVIGASAIGARLLLIVRAATL